MSEFCFLNIFFTSSDKMKLVSFNNKGTQPKCEILNCIFDGIDNKYITLLEIKESKTFDVDESTHTINQLGLGACEGIKTVPPTFLTHYFSDSSFF